jgi:competence protein ComEC
MPSGSGSISRCRSSPGAPAWGRSPPALAIGGRPRGDPSAARALLLALLAALGGRGVAGLRTASVAEPVLGFRYYGPIEGRIVVIDRSQSDKPRLTLDRVVLRDVPPDRTPARVRVSLHGEQRLDHARTGADRDPHRPPLGPRRPGRARRLRFPASGLLRRARRRGLHPHARPGAAAGRGGQGGPSRLPHPHGGDAAEIEATIPGPAGGFAAAITTGVRASIDAETTEALRASSLQHILSISGLHMVLVTAFVFGCVRGGLAAIPPLALRVPAKKIAAGAALVAGALYLALSGADVPAERAFIQVAVVLVAVLLDRRALTLRAVALAALIVLTLRPEALMEPGFQMSFAATVALVAGFEAWRDSEKRLPKGAPGLRRSSSPRSSRAPPPRPSRPRISTWSRITGFWPTRSPCRSWGCS